MFQIHVAPQPLLGTAHYLPLLLVTSSFKQRGPPDPCTHYKYSKEGGLAMQ